MSHNPSDPRLDDALIEVSRAAAAAAADLQRRESGRLEPAAWSEKGTSDFVTEVDRESERLIVRAIHDRFPGSAILAEEGTAASAADPEGDLLWIIDPLDGTTNWLHGYPEYAVSIATLDPDGLRTALVLNSATGEEFTAIRGRGAKRDGETIRVSRLTEPRLALLGTGFPFKRSELIPGYVCALAAMLEATSGVRRAGAAALDLCDVACGRLDAFWEHWLMEWDVAAGALLVREAGGTFAPLPDAGDAALEEAVGGGARVCAAFEGRTRLDGARGGGFVAGNGGVEERLKELWIDAVRRARAS
ncbi:MAG: inositol monophosphatase [Gemmatimonadetes bacterium]|nr:inositol monophosphatase [Gemmatimonadota bacterium]